MKQILSIAFLALGISIASVSHAQDDTTGQTTISKVGHGIKKGTKKAWKGTKKGAKAVGNKTAEVASKGAAAITDKKSDEFVGPDGQTIYVDDVNKFYWVDKKGKKIFVDKAELKAKQ